MYTVNGRVFLVCKNGPQFMKRLTQNLSSNSLCLRFATCSVQKSKRNLKEKSTVTLLFNPVKIKPRKDSEKIGEELTGKLELKDILKITNAFSRSPEVKSMAAESGLNGSFFQRGFLSFRKYCLESEVLPPDLHIVMSDLVKNAGNIVDIFPFFLRFVKEVFPHLECMDDLKKIGDIRQPAAWYVETRAIKRKFYFHCGPTNSGKTYHAIKRFLASESGIYCAPLKLLAFEIYKKANSSGTPCDLFTGDEIIYTQEDGNHSKHESCTIEMCPVDRMFEVAVIDEVQMLKDVQRGWAWTRALLGIRAKEIHLCGEEAALGLVDSILCTTNEEIEVKRYERLTKLHLDQPLKSWSNVRAGDCIVCFSKSDLLRIAKSLEKLGHNVAVIYGSLPPQTKLAQCEKFNDPNNPCNVLVATDAVGMGLNLNVRRIVFYSLFRPITRGMGERDKTLISVSQALQIAGRAGRYGSIYEEGYVTTFRAADFETLKSLMSQNPETVECGGLAPTADQIETFSYYLPNLSLSDTIELLQSVSMVDNSLYFLCDVTEMKVLSHMIDHVPLPLKMKYVFCCAPINRKLHFVCVMFVKYAKMCSSNQAVTVSWICQNINWPLSRPSKLQELADLEAYYDVLDLYLWLSYRFGEFFPDADVIRKMQNEIDKLIQEGVMNLTKLGSTQEDSLPVKEQEEKREESSLHPLQRKKRVT